MPDLRRATPADIPRLMAIRGAVQENRLSDPGSVTRADYDWFVDRGRVWVAEQQGRVAGFSAADDRDGTIWALFIDPADQGNGLASGLLDRACTDLANSGHTVARLTTDPGTKADRLYRKLGWVDLGLGADGEVQFERTLKGSGAKPLPQPDPRQETG